MTTPTPAELADPFAWVDAIEWHKPAHRSVMASVNLGGWLSAALDDPSVCDAMKADIREWFSAGEPMETLGQTLASLRAGKGWLPIESAPKDGRRFITGRFTGLKNNHDGLVQVDRWHSRKRGDSYDGLGKFNSQFWPATHWMPLPLPPEN